MATIITPPQPQQQYQEKEDKTNFWDTLLKGLQIANSGLGIAVDINKIQAYRDEAPTRAYQTVKAGAEAEKAKIDLEEAKKTPEQKAADREVMAEAAARGGARGRSSVPVAEGSKEDYALKKSKVDLESAMAQRDKSALELQKLQTEGKLGKEWGVQQDKDYSGIVKFDKAYNVYTGSLDKFEDIADQVAAGKLSITDPKVSNAYTALQAATAPLQYSLARTNDPRGVVTNKDLIKAGDTIPGSGKVGIDMAIKAVTGDKYLTEGPLNIIKAIKVANESAFYDTLKGGGYRSSKGGGAGEVSSQPTQKDVPKRTPEEEKKINDKFKKQFGF